MLLLGLNGGISPWFKLSGVLHWYVGIHVVFCHILVWDDLGGEHTHARTHAHAHGIEG